MPFKSEKIKYGQPQDPYDWEEASQFAQDLSAAIHLSRDAVGIKFFFTQEEYDAYDAKEPSVAMPYCGMVKLATAGRPFKSRLQHHNCDGATTALGLEPSTQRIEDGEEYFSYQLYASVAAARRHRASIRSLHRQEAATYGILTCPLSQCRVRPDVVILLVNPYQAMRIVQGYEYETGIKPEIDLGAMQGMCSEVTASPYLSGQLNVSVLCPSTRMLCKWSESDMAVGIPFEQFSRIVRGVIATIPNY